MQEPQAVGVCLKALPLRKLRLEYLFSEDVYEMLRAMRDGHVAQTLEEIDVKQLQKNDGVLDRGNRVIIALTSFPHLRKVSLGGSATNFSPLIQLPALKELVGLWLDMECKQYLHVLPQLVQLETFYM